MLRRVGRKFLASAALARGVNKRTLAARLKPVPSPKAAELSLGLDGSETRPYTTLGMGGSETRPYTNLGMGGSETRPYTNLGMGGSETRPYTTIETRPYTGKRADEATVPTWTGVLPRQETGRDPSRFSR